MDENVRKSGINIVGDIPWGTRFCQFYKTKQDLLDIVISYLKAGLENNELCLWVTSESLKVEEAKEALRKDISDIDVYLEKGQIEIISGTDWYLKEGIFNSQRIFDDWTEKLNQALKNGYEGLRATAYTCWLEMESCNDFVDYEERLNSFINKNQIIYLCTYFLDACSTADIIEIVTNHEISLTKKKGKWKRIDNSRRKSTIELKKVDEDITKRMHAEESLRKSEEQYRMLFTNMSEGFGLAEIIYDKDGNPYDYRYLELNPAFEFHTGISRNQALGKSYLEIFPNANPIAIEKFGEVAVTGQSTNFEVFSPAVNRYLNIYAFSPEKGKFAAIFRDITKSKLAEQKLRENQERLLIAKEAAGIGIHDYDLASGIIQWDERVRELWGVGQEETITYDKFMAGIHPEDRAITQESIDRALDPASKGKYYTEYRVLRDGLEHWVAATGNAFFEQGRAIRLIGTIQDITERKRMENSLKINQDRLNDLLSSIQDGFFELDNEWRFTYINKRAANNGNFEPEDLIRENIWEKFPYMVNSKFEEVYRKVMDTRLPDYFEIKSLILNKWYEVSIYPSTAGISVFWRDITERKQAEEDIAQQARLLNLSYDAILIRDSIDRITYWNIGAQEIYGYTREEALGCIPHELLRTEFPQSLEEIFETLRRDGRWMGELVHTRKDGRKITVATRWVLDQDAQGNLTSILEANSDITKRKQAEEALRKSEENYRLLFTNMTEAFFLAEIICDKDGKPYDYRYLETNPACRLNSGVKKGQIVGKSHLEVFPNANPMAIEEFGKVALSGRSTTFDIFSQETGKYLEIYAFSPEKGRFAVIFKDITERKQAEELVMESRAKLEAALASMTDAVFISDAQGNFINFNDAFATFHKFKNKDQCAKTFAEYPDILDVFMSDGTQAPVNMWAVPRALRGEIATDAEYILQRKDTGETWVGSYNFAPIRDKEGAVVGSVVIGRDITERKAIDAVLSHQREILQRIFDNIPILLVIWDPHLEQFTLNRHAEEVLGWTTADANNGDFMAKVYLDPAYRAEVTSYMLSLKTGWREWIGATKNGQHVPIEWANIFLNDDTMIGIGVDLRERKKAEAKLKETLDNLEILVKIRTAELEKAYMSLKESEKGLAEAQKMAHLGNWNRNLVTNELYWSDEMYRIFGLKPQEAINYDKFLSYVHPDDRHYVYNSTKEAFNGKVYATDYRIVRPDGEERIVHLEREVIFDEKNNPVRMKGIIQDVTERKIAEENLRLSEERYRSFIQNFKGIAFQIDRNFNLEFIHGAVKEITGYSKEELLSDRLWKKIVVPEDIDIFLKTEEKLVQSPGDNQGEFDYRIRTKDGKIKWMHEFHQKISGESGKPEKYTGIIYDITEKKEAEDALAKFEIARQKELHHRIKNNLQVISSLLDLEAEKFNNRKSVESTEVLEAFRESQNRVMSIAFIHKELHEGGDLDTLNFSLYLEKLAENLSQTYHVGNANINLNLDLEENVFYDMDISIPLGMIVNELVSNSFKYAFSGRDKGTIQIKLLREDIKNEPNNKEELIEKGTKYTLIVSDNGIGIPEELDIENSDTLGLQLVNILVDQLDGKIELKRDEGTEFKIILYSNKKYN